MTTMPGARTMPMPGPARRPVPDGPDAGPDDAQVSRCPTPVPRPGPGRPARCPTVPGPAPRSGQMPMSRCPTDPACWRRRPGAPRRPVDAARMRRASCQRCDGVELVVTDGGRSEWCATVILPPRACVAAARVAARVALRIASLRVRLLPDASCVRMCCVVRSATGGVNICQAVCATDCARRVYRVALRRCVCTGDCCGGVVVVVVVCARPPVAVLRCIASTECQCNSVVCVCACRVC